MSQLLALISILIPISLFAQGFGSFSHDQPFLSASANRSSDPATNLPVILPGIGYWWVASDLTSSPVTTWTDRVSGFILTQPTGANQPTWTTNGVRFTAASGQYLLTNGTPPIFWKFSSGGPTTSGDAMLVILDRASTGEKYFISPSSGTILGFSPNAWHNGNVTFGITTTGQWYDYFYGGTNFGSGNFNTFTNGVLANSSPSVADSPLYFGRLSSGFFFDGTVKEIVVWTNIQGTTSLQASNIHFYATNKYNYSP